MKKLITICVGLIVVGCDNSSQLAEANAKIQDLEKRLEKIEEKVDFLAKCVNENSNGGLVPAHRFAQMDPERKEQMKKAREELFRKNEEAAAAREAEKERKRVEAEREAAKKAEDKKAVDAKIVAFIKEYLGVQFGDSIDKFPDSITDDSKDRCRAIKLLKKFKYFDKAAGYFYCGQLYGVMLYTDLNEKYSIDSRNEKMFQTIVDLAVTFGIPDTKYDSSRNLTSYYLYTKIGSVCYGLMGDGFDPVFYYSPPKGYMRYGAAIVDKEFVSRLKEEARLKKNAEGETLPDPE